MSSGRFAWLVSLGTGIRCSVSIRKRASLEGVVLGRFERLLQVTRTECHVPVT